MPCLSNSIYAVALSATQGPALGKYRVFFYLSRVSDASSLSDIVQTELHPSLDESLCTPYEASGYCGLIWIM